METGVLGDIVFEASSWHTLVPQSISAESRMRYEEHKVFGSYPAQEWLGPENAEMSIDVRLSRRLLQGDPDEAKKKLMVHMKLGHILRLTLCGQNWGKYVILSIGQKLSTRLAYDASGIGPSYTDLTIKLRAWHWDAKEAGNGK